MTTEDTILKKTFNLLLIKGFDAVSITDIQVETGLSRGLLYHYFKNKEDLFIKVTEKYFVQIFDFDVKKTENYTIYGFTDFICKRFKKIDKTISDIVSETSGTQDVSMLNYHYLFYQVMQRNEVFRNRYRSTTEKELIGWEYALKNSILTNEIRDNIDIVISARQLFILTDGIWFQGVFDANGKVLIKNLKSTLLHYIELLK